MTYPAFSSDGSPETVGGPVTCNTCGCRLERAEDLTGWLHFAPMAGRDARGCRIACADEIHDARGHSLSR